MTGVEALSGIAQYQHAVDEVVGQGILVTGAARSGTTLMGKLIASCQGVEYLFEPPTLYALLALHQMPTLTFKTLWSTYLFEDFLLDALAGRRLNLNRGDESQVWTVKSSEEVESRLMRSWSRAETLRVASGHTLAYKLTDAARFLPLLKNVFPQHCFIVMYRPPEDVLRSLYRKEWFHDKTVASPLAVGYPWRELTEDMQSEWLATPFWVLDRYTWQRANAIERYELYYQYAYGYPPPAAYLTPAIVSYRQLCDYPRETIKVLLGLLGLEPGEKTAYILDGVRRAYRYPVVSQPDAWDDAHTSYPHHCIMGELEDMGEKLGKCALDVLS